ncbi:uncharacterized protein TNCT_133891 [Trichonephila clavata]|uniref:Uncharacterized protein n=1 Tax=Trichonephila clavata TaxID=2740835 RepID=A0A8X6JDG7_TRICU|nr:uncharacterized protein TNCT_133891 [Trichonephila clavata]
METNNQPNLAVNSNTNQKKIPSEPFLIAFDPENGMRIEAWLEYFNNACKISNKDNDWKMLNISKYLKGSALTHYVNSCLNISNFDDLCNILIENFLKPNIVNLSDFSQHQLRNNLDEYFHQKLNYGRELGLSPQLILEGLTDGMPTNIKQLMTINPPTSPTEWLKLTRIKDFINNPDEKDKIKSESKMDTLKSLRIKLSDIRNEYYAVVTSESDLEPLELEILDLEDDCEDIQSDILNSVSDLVLKQPENGKYDALKKRLIEVHSESEDSKIRILLQGLELGDQWPSQLLTRMRSLAGDNVGKPLLKSLWLGRLPNGTQTILAALNENLDQLATVADKINDLTFPQGINSVAATSKNKTAQLE